MGYNLAKPYYFYKTLAFICLMILPVFISGCEDKQPKEETSTEQVEKKPVMRILFVGNQYSSSNNMPNILQALAQNDPSSHFDLEIGNLIEENASLAQLWKHNDRKKILTQKKWDYVILQPHPLWASSEGGVYFTHKSLSVWSKTIESIGAIPVFIMNWPLEKTDPIYGNPKYFGLKNYQNMHRMLRGYSKALAKKNDMILMPIGDYWMYCMSKNNNISLYGESTENFEDTDNTEIENNIENTINKFLPPLTDGTYPTLEESFAKTVNNASNVNFGRISSKESSFEKFV